MQFRQTAARTPEYVPPGQLVHAADAAAEYVPDEQLVQAEAMAVEYVPAAHDRHSAAPSSE